MGQECWDKNGKISRGQKKGTFFVEVQESRTGTWGRWRRCNHSSGPGMQRKLDLSLSCSPGVEATPYYMQSENKRGERSSLFDKESKLILLSKEEEK